MLREEARRQAAECKACGRPLRTDPNATKRFCAEHAAEFKKRRNARLDAKICTMCKTRPIGEKSRYRCDECVASDRALRAERRAAGLCTRCGAPAADGISLCAPHAKDARAYQALGYTRRTRG